MYIKRSYYNIISISKSLYPHGTFSCLSNEINSITVKIIMKESSISYSGATSLFMTVLLNKKYSLPYVVLDGLVDHFMSFEDDDRELPVLWHQV